MHFGYGSQNFQSGPGISRTSSHSVHAIVVTDKGARVGLHGPNAIPDESACRAGKNEKGAQGGTFEHVYETYV